MKVWKLKALGAMAVLASIAGMVACGEGGNPAVVDPGLPVEPVVRFTYELHGSNAGITGLAADSQDATDIVIPESIDGHPVNTIEHEAFLDNKKLVSVDIGDGVVYIYDYAFKGCTALKTFKIGSSLQDFFPDLLKDDLALETFDVDPANNYFRSIDGALYTLNKENLVMFPPSKDAALTSFPADLLALDTKAFAGYQGTSLEVPSQVKTIDQNCFSLTKLQSIDFPGTLSVFQSYAFFENVELLTMTFHQYNAPSVGTSVFPACLTAIKVPAARVDAYKASWPGKVGIISGF